MYTIIIILMLVAAVLLGLVVLVQNPKGGGLNASLGGVSNQVFGAKKSTDIVEKTTWYLAFAVFLLCLVSVTQIKVGNADDFNTEETKIENLIEELPSGVDIPVE